MWEDPQGSYIGPFPPATRGHFLTACVSPPLSSFLLPPLSLEAIKPTSTGDKRESRARPGEMIVCLAKVFLGSWSGTAGGSLGASRTLRRGRWGLVSKLVALIGWWAAAGKNPDVPGSSCWQSGVLRCGRSRGAGSPRGWRGVGLASPRRS